MKHLSYAAGAAALVMLAAGCGTSESSSSSGDASTKSEPALEVSAAFYPLTHAVEKVGGDKVKVTTVTKPGVEAHDLELTPQDVAGLSKADLVVYQKGFQPAVDEAVGQLDAKKTFDVATSVDLTVPATDDGHDHSGEGEGKGHDHKHEGEHDHEHEDEKSASPSASPSAKPAAVDPHFWLDPTRYAQAVKAIATKLGQADSANAAAYTANAATFAAELTTLDSSFTAGLKTCTNRDLVTSHAAFAYLAARYKFTQMGISGITPDAEPSAAAMKDIAEHVREHTIRTIYAETLVSPDLANTVAKETGATMAVLDPIEGLTDRSAGKNYVEIMKSNLATLVKGQGCT